MIKKMLNIYKKRQHQPTPTRIIHATWVVVLLIQITQKSIPITPMRVKARKTSWKIRAYLTYFLIFGLIFVMGFLPVGRTAY